MPSAAVPVLRYVDVNGSQVLSKEEERARKVLHAVGIRLDAMVGLYSVMVVVRRSIF